MSSCDELLALFQAGEARLVGPRGEEHLVPAPLYGLMQSLLDSLKRGGAVTGACASMTCWNCVISAGRCVAVPLMRDLLLEAAHEHLYRVHSGPLVFKDPGGHGAQHPGR
jgi:hypothetical protein